MDANAVVEVQDIGQFTVVAIKYFISDKGKSGDSRVEKPGREQFDQVFKAWHYQGSDGVMLGISLWNGLREMEHPIYDIPAKNICPASGH